MSDLKNYVLIQLQCKLCFKYMKPPIRLCSRGHSACDECVKKFLTCTSCKYPFLTTRNQALEELFYEMGLGCGNCEIQQLDAGTKGAQGKIYKCKKEITEKNYMKRNCKWSGCIDEIYDHFKTQHQNSVYDLSCGRQFQWTLPFAQNQIDYNVILQDNDKFLHYVYYDYAQKKIRFTVTNLVDTQGYFIFEIQVNEGQRIFEGKVLHDFYKSRDLIRGENCVEISLETFQGMKCYERIISWNLFIYKIVA